MEGGFSISADGTVSMHKYCDGLIPDYGDGYITVNLDNVVDMRPAEDDEIEHAKIHGW